MLDNDTLMKLAAARIVQGEIVKLAGEGGAQWWQSLVGPALSAAIPSLLSGLGSGEGLLGGLERLFMGQREPDYLKDMTGMMKQYRSFMDEWNKMDETAASAPSTATAPNATTPIRTVYRSTNPNQTNLLYRRR